MTRIIAGAGRGVRLDVPERGTRPTTDKVKEALFSALEAQAALAETRILDLFAGSGALALEALSRGAATADLVEKAPSALKILRKNCQLAKKWGQIRLHQQTADRFLRSFLPAQNPQWQLVFIDPPYDYSETDLENTMQLLHPLLDPDAWIVVERSSRNCTLQWPEALWEVVREKRYGETTLFYLRPALPA